MSSATKKIWCKVKKCPTNQKGNRKNHQIFDFPGPEERDRRKQWFKAVKIPSLPSDQYGVCDIHFSGDSFIPEAENTDVRGRSRKLKQLQPGAIPTQHLGDIISDIIMPEHSYSATVGNPEQVPSDSQPSTSSSSIEKMEVDFSNSAPSTSNENVNSDSMEVDFSNSDIVVSSELDNVSISTAVKDPVIEQLESRIKELERSHLKNLSRIQTLEKENQRLTNICSSQKKYLDSFKKLFTEEQIDMITGRISYPLILGFF